MQKKEAVVYPLFSLPLMAVSLDIDNNIFFPPKPYSSWVKDTATANWKSPIGDAPALTAEQTSQNEAGTHSWGYDWNESGQSWDLTDRLA